MIVRITAKYGEVSKLHPKGHTGVDIGVSEGTPILSVHDGVVDKIYDGGTSLGNGVVVSFEDGTKGIYGHMSEVNVKVGELVQDGQILGFSGNTGRSTGPHLHFSMVENGQYVDPTSLVEHTVNHTSIWDKIMDVQSIGGWLYEKFISGGIEYWVSNYIMALPFLVGVSIGVWGLLSMVNRKIANFGVGLVMVLGGIVII